MKIYKWLRGLMKASALTTVMFIMQACYGSPNAYRYEMNGVVVDKTTGLPLKDIEFRLDGKTMGFTDDTGYFEIYKFNDVPTDYQLSFIDSVGRYHSFDTLIKDFYSNDLKIRLESNE